MMRDTPVKLLWSKSCVSSIIIRDIFRNNKAQNLKFTLPGALRGE